MTATKPSRKRRAARRAQTLRSGRPARCRDCLAPVLWATIRPVVGVPYRRPVNADAVPHGGYEYVAGSISDPVLRQLDDHERYAPPDGARYVIHRCEEDL